MILKLLLNIRIISTKYMKTVCSPYKNGKTLMVFDDMVFDMLENKKKIQQIVTKLFIRGRKLNVCLGFIVQSYFAVPNNITIDSPHYFITKVPDKQELQ